MLKRFFKSDAKIYALFAALLGAVLFFLIFGFESLAVTNVSFIYNATDRASGYPDVPFHQFAIDYYMRSPWTFPVGTISGYPYPYDTTILLADGIPLMAIFFKLFSFALPPYFQFFGIWTLLCFMLQATGAALLMRKLGMKLLPAVCAVPFFILNVPLLFRCFHHCSLCAQWMILFALLGLFYSLSFSKKERLLYWGIMCGMAVMIHGYLLLIVGIIMAISVLYLSISDRKMLPHSIVVVTVSGAVSVFLYFICSGFSPDKSINVLNGLGRYVFDPGFLTDPSVFSGLISPGLKTGVHTEQDEYLGIAVMILCLIALAVLIVKRKRVTDYIGRHKTLFILLACMALGLFLISLSPAPQINGKKVFDLIPYIPEKMYSLLSIFRSSARFFWPVFYLLILSVMFTVYKAFPAGKEHFFALMLLPFLLLQFIEIVPNAVENKADSIVSGYDSEMEHSLGACLGKNARHVAFISNTKKNSMAAGVFAVQNGMTFNISTVVAGDPDVQIADLINVSNSIFENDTVYVIPLNKADITESIDLPADYRAYMDGSYLYILSSELLIADPLCMDVTP